jgi:hypothetical protein
LEEKVNWELRWMTGWRKKKNNDDLVGGVQDVIGSLSIK